MTTADIIRIMQESINGKTIQVRHRPGADWQDTDNPAWDWIGNEYRVKPEPREWLVYLDCHGNIVDKSKTYGNEIIKVREVLP